MTKSNKLVTNVFRNKHTIFGKLSKKEILTLVKAYIQDNEDLTSTELANDLLKLEASDLKLVLDIINLTKNKRLKTIELDTKKEYTEKITTIILSKIPILSKINPYALELAQEVIDITDKNNATYFVINFFTNDLSTLTAPKLQMKAAKSIIIPLAKDIFKDYIDSTPSQHEEFFGFLTYLLNTKVNPENIKIITRAYNLANSICKNTKQEFSLNKILFADYTKVQENYSKLRNTLKYAETNNLNIDIAEFLAQNTNLAVN